MQPLTKEGISLAVEKGEIVTLIGANGADKTTTLKAISGMRHPTRREIWFQNERIDKLRTQKSFRWASLTFPKGRRLFPLMTVLGTLLTGAFLLKEKNEINKNLERVYEHFPILKERTKQIAETLSGGEQQMLAMGARSRGTFWSGTNWQRLSLALSKRQG